MNKVKTRKPRTGADPRSGDLFSQPPSPPPAQGGEPAQRAPEGPTLSEFASRAYLAYAMSVVIYSIERVSASATRNSCLSIPALLK